MPLFYLWYCRVVSHNSGKRLVTRPPTATDLFRLFYKGLLRLALRPLLEDLRFVRKTLSPFSRPYLNIVDVWPLLGNVITTCVLYCTPLFQPYTACFNFLRVLLIFCVRFLQNLRYQNVAPLKTTAENRLRSKSIDLMGRRVRRMSGRSSHL